MFWLVLFLSFNATSANCNNYSSKLYNLIYKFGGGASCWLNRHVLRDRIDLISMWNLVIRITNWSSTDIRESEHNLMLSWYHKWLYCYVMYSSQIKLNIICKWPIWCWIYSKFIITSQSWWAYQLSYGIWVMMVLIRIIWMWLYMEICHINDSKIPLEYRIPILINTTLHVCHKEFHIILYYYINIFIANIVNHY